MKDHFQIDVERQGGIDNEVRADRYYDYTNMQFTTFVQNQSAIKNASAAELYGLEIELQAVPAALPGLAIDGSASWLHSEYTGGNPYDPEGLFPDPSQRMRLDIRGNELIRAPKFRSSFGAQYKIDMISVGTLTLRGEVSWTDTIYHDIFNGKAPYEAATTQPAYWLLNARLTWQPHDSHFRIQLFGENLADALYATNRVAFNRRRPSSTFPGSSPPRALLGSAR